MFKTRVLKTILSLALALVFVVSLAGCGSNTDTATSTIAGTTAQETANAEVTKEETKAEPVELKFLYIWPEYEATMTKSIKSFEDKNPNVKVQVDVTPWDQVIKVLQTRIASNDQPDVSFMWPHSVNMFSANNQALDLSSYMTDDWKGTFLNENELVPGTVDGKLYAIPFKGTCYTLFYNQDLMDKAGVAFPQYVEDIPAAAEKLKEQGASLLGLAGKPQGYAFATFINTLAQGEQILKHKMNTDDQWKKYRLINDTFKQTYIRSYELTKEYSDKGYIMKNSISMTREEMQAAFVSGKVAAIFANNNEYNSIKQTVSFKLGAAALPSYKELGNVPLVGGSFDGFFVAASTENPKESVELLKHLTSNEVQSMWVEETGCSGVVKGLQTKDPVQTQIMKVFENFQPDSPSPDYTKNDDNRWIAMSEYFFKNDVTAEEAVDKYCEVFKKEFETYDKSKE